MHTAGDGRSHVVVFPYMAKGHTIPLLYLAAHLAAVRGIRVTVVTTPANSPFIRGHVPSSVDVAELAFPSLPPLPAGVESTDQLPSPELYPVFYRATALLGQPFAELLQEIISASSSPPLALISDFFLGFTYHVAAAAGVPRIVFHGMSIFSMALCKTLGRMVAEIPDGEDTHFAVPGTPPSVMFTRSEIPDAVRSIADMDNPITQFLIEQVFVEDASSWGLLVNSFAAVEEEPYVRLLEQAYFKGARAWTVGPLRELRPFPDDGAARGDDADGCLSWLDEKLSSSPPERNILYVSFGTQAVVGERQLEELAYGLVAAGVPFLWAVRADGWAPPADCPMGMNKIARGWVPQKAVLEHPAVGAFMSHCGWNSVLESLCAGVPLLAWPMMAEQPLNAKQVVEILNAGVHVGKSAAGAGRFVARSEIAEAIKEVLGGGERGRKVCAKAGELRDAAQAAVAAGGSSEVALGQLLEELQKSYDGDRRRRKLNWRDAKGPLSPE